MTEFSITDLDQFQEWAENLEPPGTPQLYLSTQVGLLGALVVARMMLPKLVEFRDCILLDDVAVPETVEQWIRVTDGDPRAIESALNRLHLRDVFDPESVADERGLNQLAEWMRSTWLLSAQSQFPSRRCVVSLVEDYGPTLVMVFGD